MAPLLWSFNARADWPQSTDPLIVQPAPTNGQVQAQNPPSFTWARHPTGPASYDIEITPAGGAPVMASVDGNWYLPTCVLSLGIYIWRLRPIGSCALFDARACSMSRRAAAILVPDIYTTC